MEYGAIQGLREERGRATLGKRPEAGTGATQANEEGWDVILAILMMKVPPGTNDQTSHRTA
jgi:hypothetical protein